MTTTTEKKVVAGLWTILILYIASSSVMMWGNRLTLSVIEERISNIVMRMEHVETLRGAMDAMKGDCLSRTRILTAEIERLKRHVATDGTWAIQISERIDDLRQRIAKLEK